MPRRAYDLCHRALPNRAPWQTVAGKGSRALLLVPASLAPVWRPARSRHAGTIESMQSRIKLSRAAAIVALAITVASPRVSASPAPADQAPAAFSPTAEHMSPEVLTRTSPRRRPLVDAVPSFRSARRLGEDLVRMQLRISRALSQQPLRSEQALPADASRMKVLAAARMDSPAALRSAAAHVRSRRPSPSRTSLVLARQAVAALYPSAPESLAQSEVALVLEAAAADHDRRTLEISVAESEDRPVLLSPLRLGQMIPSGASASSAASLQELLSAGVELQRRYRSALVEAAGFVLASAGVTDSAAVSELAATWAEAGYRRANATLTALAQVGKTYRFASRGPDAFDCSGLTAFAWAHSGLHLPTSSFSQQVATASLGAGQARALPGDLVFYKIRTGRSGAPSGHVALWLGSGSLIVEAQQSADQVRVATISSTLFSSYGQVRLAGERAEVLLLPQAETGDDRR